MRTTSHALVPAGTTLTDEDYPFSVTDGARGVVVFVNPESGAGSVVVTIQGVDDVSGVKYTLLQSASISGTTMVALVVYPGVAAVANTTADKPLPREVNVNVNVTDALVASIAVQAVR